MFYNGFEGDKLAVFAYCNVNSTYADNVKRKGYQGGTPLLFKEGCPKGGVV
jgi:hypothetical protein